MYVTLYQQYRPTLTSLGNSGVCLRMDIAELSKNLKMIRNHSIREERMGNKSMTHTGKARVHTIETALKLRKLTKTMAMEWETFSLDRTTQQ
jgi:hypothetical protein